MPLVFYGSLKQFDIFLLTNVNISLSEPHPD
jgi:hypothetical protein